MPTTTADPAPSLYARATAAQAAGRYDEGVRLLWQASEQGDVAAMSLLGAQLLSGRGAAPDPPAGAQLILRAAELGGGYACALAATMTAAGLYVPAADWGRALDWLERGAEAGYCMAQDQLRVLARSPAGAKARPGDWARLRRRIDLNAWRAAPPARPLSPDAPIQTVPGFAAPDVCDWIIGRARGRLEPAMIFDTAQLRPVRKDNRSNSAAGFDLVNLDLVVLLIRERLAAAGGHPTAHMEAPQVFHYAPGQQFAPHYDFLDPDFPAHAEDIARRGQRVQTLLIYLNQGFEGGETDFPLLGLRFKGGRGDALMFMNTEADGAPDRRMYHAGLPPSSGEKWLFSQWVRDGKGGMAR